MSLLEVANLEIRFGRHRRPGLADLSFTIEAGERVGMIGESGSGKTITALAIMGLLPPTAHATGKVLLSGTDMISTPDRELSRLRGDKVGMVFQEPMTALDPTMKVGRQVGEAIRLHYRNTDLPAREFVCEAFADLDLADPERIADSYPHQLSGGQRQRVMIAMATINQPDLLLCDEPTTALDVTVQATVLDLLRRKLDQRDTACLFISHDLAVVSQIADRCLVLKDGKLVCDASISDTLNRPTHPYVAQLVAAAFANERGVYE